MREAAIFLAVVAALLVAQPVVANPVPKQGTFEAVTQPPYHYLQPLTFHWLLPKRPHFPVFAILCRQNDQWAYVAEQGHPRLYEDSGTLTVDNAMSGGVSGTLDYTSPAFCTAEIFDELGGGQQPALLAPAISFVVNP
jgi:hypothetical protein